MRPFSSLCVGRGCGFKARFAQVLYSMSRKRTGSWSHTSVGRVYRVTEVLVSVSYAMIRTEALSSSDSMLSE